MNNSGTDGRDEYIEKLVAELAELEAQNAELKAQNADLRRAIEDRAKLVFSKKGSIWG